MITPTTQAARELREAIVRAQPQDYGDTFAGRDLNGDPNNDAEIKKECDDLRHLLIGGGPRLNADGQKKRMIFLMFLQMFRRRAIVGSKYWDDLFEALRPLCHVAAQEKIKEMPWS